MSELLPVGSVVSVDEGKNVQMMIVGYYPVDSRKKECYQYLGVIYPSGTTVKNDVMNMFNHADIRKVIFEGYSTDAAKKALRELTEYTEKVLSGDIDETSAKNEEDLFF